MVEQSADMPHQHVPVPTTLPSIEHVQEVLGVVTSREVQPGVGPQLVQAVPVPLQQQEQANAQEVPVEGGGRGRSETDCVRS